MSIAMPEPTVRIPTLNLRVLIAEDHPEISRLLALILRKYGCEVQQCHSGFSAITTAPIFRPDVMLLDIGLPGLNGFEVAEHLIETMGDDRPHLIAITAYTQERFRLQAEESGIDRYWTKPVDSRQILSYLLDFQSQSEQGYTPRRRTTG